MSPPKTFISFPSPRLSRYQRSGFNLTQRSHETSLGTVHSPLKWWESEKVFQRQIGPSHLAEYFCTTRISSAPQNSLFSLSVTLWKKILWMLFQETEKTSHLPVLTLANIQTVTSTLGQELFPLAIASGFAASPFTTSKTLVHCLFQS